MKRKRMIPFVGLCLCFFVFLPYLRAEENTKEVSFLESKLENLKLINSEELVRLAWDASGKKDLAAIKKIVAHAIKEYGDKASKQQAKLKALPGRDKVKEFEELNDVGTLLFIEAEALMHQGKTTEAIDQFKTIIANYGYAQAWDPRGWYWSVAEKSQASINVLTGQEQKSSRVVKKGVKTVPVLHFPGTQKVINYSQYGKFVNVGTKDYHFTVTDAKDLAEAVGEGIYPNNAVRKDPEYQRLRKEGRLEGSIWDFVNTEDLQAAFYKWATTTEESPGVRLFYIALIFEKAQMYREALMAYHASIVHFPNAVAWTYWQTPWYPGQVAIAKIRHILRLHPELGLKSKWMKIQVRNGFDNDTKNDEIVTFPGVIEAKNVLEQSLEKVLLEFDAVRLGKPKKTVGQEHIQLVQYENGHWQLLVKNKPYVIRAVTYAPVKIGQSPDKGTLENWMLADENKNGRADGPYDSWVDKNRNNEKDPNEQVVGDFQLMKDLGVNTLRIYHNPTMPKKEILKDLYEHYGIRVIMGDFLGKYTLGSGATWFEGTDYDNPQHKANMLDSVKKMVMEYKDEPYVLLWLLGNENNYGVACNADKKPESYFKFVDEVARWIKSVDPNHPVAVSNGDTLFLDKFAQHAPSVDIFAANVYRGDFGFGSFWEQVFDATGKPAFITEYGAPAYAPHLTESEAEEAQANYHLGNWLDIEANLAGRSMGAGNALGGVVFEWMDEWWKSYEPGVHDAESNVSGPFPGGFYYEEWFGIISQGDGKNSPFARQLRKAYFLYKDLWKNNK